ncbi:hypothetical protein KX928_09960 [Roseobacter sp. YSTF-M11]|uniref:Response regulatory domain-containing protein n=1 Tax=Roseobacter insulae TaxID=2859783 RepID=A0A9X1FUS7_9RHOB|nr:hypothetical protein [Roseobacter insulae]MBW4708111.1 hypothetical protein [Roseobacter insulae]
MEDEFTVSYSLMADLRKAGHQVQAKASASQAIIELREVSYDVLITDIIVKEQGRAIPDGGIGLISWVRHHHGFSRMPIIAISGTTRYPGMETILSTAKNIGADIGFEKPVVLSEILKAIDCLTAENRSEDARAPD